MRRPGGLLAASPLRLSLLALVVASSGLVGLRADASPVADAAQTVARRYGVVPFRETSTGGSAHPKANAPVRSTAATPHLSYYAGPVVAKAEVHPVLYGTGAYVPQSLPGAAAPNVKTFLDNFVTSTAYTWLSEYDTNIPTQAKPLGTPGTNQHIVAGAAVAQVTIAPASPGAGACAALGVSPPPPEPCITDLDLQGQLAAAINGGTLPHPTVDAAGNVTAIYPVFTPSGLTVCIDRDTCSLRAGGFCAYHGAFDLNGVPVVYTVQPDLTVAVVASQPCGAGNGFQVTTAVLSHELVETVTDPLGPVAALGQPPMGWYDWVTTGLGEITDICQDVDGTFLGADGATYTVQGQWSNASLACIIDKAQPPLTPPAPGPGPGAALDTSNPVSRVLDTRKTAPVGPQGAVAIHTTSPGASAVVLNVAAVGATVETYITAWPCDQARPTASNLNVVAGDTVANLVTVQVAANGDVCAYNNAGRVDLVVDEMASYREVAGAVATGRFVGQVPTRALDTRTTNTPFGVSEERQLDLKPFGVPDNALAVVVTITAPDSRGAGYWAVWPSGAWPGTSSLNLSARNQTRANQSILSLDRGTIKMRSQIGGHLVVDVAGWFTGSGGAIATTGLFHPVAPSRRVDTRGGGVKQTGLNLVVGSSGDIPADASALALNVTVTQPVAAGFAVVYPDGAAQPTASNLNFSPGATVPGHVIAGLGAGAFHVRTNVPSYFVIDIFGWYS